MTTDPYPQRTPCPFSDCETSAEEHHRLLAGYISENKSMRERLKQGKPETVDLSSIPLDEILDEIGRRVRG